MNQDQAAEILLIRTVEEFDEDVFTEEKIKDAFTKADGHVGQADWFARRAAYLIEYLPPPYRLILQMVKFPGRFLAIICLAAFLTGIATNFLGPSGKIHVIFNSILILVGWNVLVYLFFVLTAFYKWFHQNNFHEKTNKTLEPSALRLKKPQLNEGSWFKTAPRQKSFWVFRKLFLTVWKAICRLSAITSGVSFRAINFGKVASEFWKRWNNIAGALVIAQWERLFHWGAISLVLGAIVGIYIRGLFLDYNVIWTSTFIRSETAVSTLIKIILGPAIIISKLLGHPFAGAPDLKALMSQNGVPAAPWIHLYTLTAIIFAIFPRLGLALLETKRVYNLQNNVRIEFDGYFFDKIKLQLEKVVQQEARIECAKLTEGVAAFVCEKLYDDQIVPKINEFRQNGGRIADLEDRIKGMCEQFSPTLEDYLNNAMVDFERSLALSIKDFLSFSQTDFTLNSMFENHDWVHELDHRQSAIIEKSIRPVGDNFTALIGGVVAVSIAGVFTTICAGLVHHLGIAIISTLTALSGPVGFLIGGLIGLIISILGWWLGREKITEKVENVNIPGVVLRKVLWTSRYNSLIEDGRQKTFDCIKEEISDKMSMLIPKIVSELVLKFKKLFNQ